MPVVILHISDPHFGTEQAPVVEALAQLAAKLQPELVVLSGDITQRARARQFAAAAAFVQRLGAPSLVIPGNHDIPLFNLWARITGPYAGYQRAFGADLQPSFENERLLVLGVNTTRAWRHTNGEVSAAQVQHIAQRLRQARPGQLRVVVVHQPIEVMRPADVPDRLIGHTAAQLAWAEAGADVVLGGHIHLPYVLKLPAALGRSMWAVQAGTAVSHRVRSRVPNSVNVLQWLPDHLTCTVQQYDHHDSTQAFEPTKETLLSVDRP